MIKVLLADDHALLRGSLKQLLDDTGFVQVVAQAIGEQPKSILTANLEALLTNSTLPYATTTGQASDFNILAGASQTDPRSHGSQVNQ